MSASHVHIKDSIATRLLKIVFLLYFIVAFSVTFIHMMVGYYNTKDRVISDLKVFKETFEPGLAGLLWELHEEQVQATLNGMMKLPGVTGIKIENKGRIFGAVGKILNQDGVSVSVDSEGQLHPMREKGLLSGIISYSFPIFYEEDGQKYEVGHGTLYSSSQIVFQEVRLEFLLIIINAFIKTTALWFIFLVISKKILGEPLSILTQAAQSLSLDNLHKVIIDVRTKGRNELKILEETFNAMIYKLVDARNKLEEANQTLENKVKERTQQLEQQNTELMASNRKLEDLNSTKERLLEKLRTLHEPHLKILQEQLDDLQQVINPDDEDIHQHITPETRDSFRQASREVFQIGELLRPVTALYASEKAIQSKRVLLAETNKKYQLLAKLALRGTGVNLDITSDFRVGEEMLRKQPYDILYVDMNMIDLAKTAHEQYLEMDIVFMTSEDISVYLPILMSNPFLSNIVSRTETDRTFTIKNILTTVSKLVSRDLFGLEKYLSWGVDLRQHPVVNSQSREDITNEMESYLKELGIRRQIIVKSSMIMEELLMNAIYDAPTNADGSAKYNHLPRTVDVELEKKEQGMARYACDGVLLAIAVEDPFGALDRKTILEYLDSCYSGKAGTLNEKKGGAGRGLFQIMETSDLVVINVVADVKTEVISIFNIDPEKSKTKAATSFHYFSE